MYRWVEHTAELELEIEAGTEEGVFTEALRACGELLADDSGTPRVSPPRELTAPEVVRPLELTASDRAALLVAFLDELVYLAETEDLVPARVLAIGLSERGLEARISWAQGQPRHLIKGATYHRLAFTRTECGYRATVVLDV